MSIRIIDNEDKELIELGFNEELVNERIAE